MSELCVAEHFPRAPKGYKDVAQKFFDCFSDGNELAPCQKLPDEMGGGFNKTTQCYSACFSAVTHVIPRAELLEPWAAAFASTDPSKGGCPTITPTSATTKAKAHPFNNCASSYCSTISDCGSGCNSCGRSQGAGIGVCQP